MPGLDALKVAPYGTTGMGHRTVANCREKGHWTPATISVLSISMSEPTRFWARRARVTNALLLGPILLLLLIVLIAIALSGGGAGTLVLTRSRAHI